MGQLFNDLTYNPSKYASIGRPVDDLKALYEKKENDYITSNSNLNSVETAINNLPALSKDEHLKQGAMDLFDKTNKKYREADNLEDRVIDTTNLAHDMANKHGLLQVQQNATSRSNQVQSLQQRYEDGEISKEAMNRAIRDADTKYEGVQYNAETDSYLGSFNMRDVLNKYNFAEENAKVMEGFKANTLILTTKDGERIIPDGKSGYMSINTQETVTEDELREASNSYLQNSPEFKDYVNDELYYEIDNITKNSETGEMTLNDLQSLLGTNMSAKLAEAYKVNSLEELGKKLEEEGITPEQLYRKMRGDQMANSASTLGIEKEGYTKNEIDTLKNWQLQDATKGTTLPVTTPEEFGMLNSWADTSNFTEEDTLRVSEMYNRTDEELTSAKNKLNKLQADYTNNPESVNPDDIDRAKIAVRDSKLKAKIMEKTTQELYNSVPEFKEGVQEILKNSFEQNKFYEEAGIYNYKDRYTDRLGIEGLNINQGSVERLLHKNIARELTTEDLNPYIQLNENQILADAYKKNQSFSTSSEDLYESILTNGKEALNVEGENNTLKSKVLEELQDKQTTSVRLLKTKLDKVTDDIKQKSKDNNFVYNKTFNTIVQPEMDAKTRRTDPVSMLKNYTQGITNNANYYTKLRGSRSGLPIIDEIVNQAKQDGNFDNIDNDNTSNIQWDKAVLDFSVDARRDANSLEYSPTIKMEVPIVSNDGKSSKTITLSVNHTEPSYTSKYTELLTKQKDKLVSASKQGNLSPSDANLLKNLNTTLYNLTEYGNNFDLLDINAMDNGSVIEHEFWEGHFANIKTFQYASPQDKSFYLIDYMTDENGSYLRNDKKERIEGYWAVNNETGQQSLVSESRLKGNTWTALGANTSEDMKSVLASFVMEKSKDKQYAIDLNETVDIASIFLTDTKGTSLARVAKSVEPSVKLLKQNFNNLIVTDGIRDMNVEYGSATSNHKKGKSLDFRLNADSNALLELNTEELKNMGIKSAAIHDDNHVHVEFL
jgi:hypothetical protein